MPILADQMPDAAQAATSASNTSGGGLIGGAFNAITGGAMSHLMGMVFGGAEDDRQYNQQERLQNLQIAGSERLAQDAENHQLDVWNKTNYEAQVQHLENAGLNPALLYAKGGPGGTLGSGNVPTPQGGTAANSAQTQEANNQTLMMGLQMKQMQAEIERAQAQAEEAHAQAVKTAGADTENTTMNTQLQQSQMAAQNISNTIAGMTMPQAVAKIQADAENAQAVALKNTNEANLSTDAYQTQLDTLKQNYINMVLTAGLIKSNVAVNQEEVKNMASEIVTRAKQLDINQGQLNVAKASQETNQQNTELQHADRNYANVITETLGKNWQELAQYELIIQGASGILKAFSGTKGSMPPIGFGK